MAEENEDSMTPSMRYYYLHRDQKKAKDLERYHNRPDVIAKREERERKKAEKEDERKTKQEEKEKLCKNKLQLALTTRKNHKKTDGGISEFLAESSPA